MKLGGNLIFIGMMGAGKTSVGRRCAQLLGMDFCDSDQIFASLFGGITTVFKEKGEDYFRQNECKIIQNLAKKQNTIIACGGGAVLSPSFVNLKSTGKVIYLSATPSTLFQRLNNDNTRPLNKGILSLESILLTRLPLYEKFADLTIPTDDKTIDQIAWQIIEQANPNYQENQPK